MNFLINFLPTQISKQSIGGPSTEISIFDVPDLDNMTSFDWVSQIAKLLYLKKSLMKYLKN